MDKILQGWSRKLSFGELDRGASHFDFVSWLRLELPEVPLMVEIVLRILLGRAFVADREMWRATFSTIVAIILDLKVATLAYYESIEGMDFSSRLHPHKNWIVSNLDLGTVLPSANSSDCYEIKAGS